MVEFEVTSSLSYKTSLSRHQETTGYEPFEVTPQSPNRRRLAKEELTRPLLLLLLNTPRPPQPPNPKTLTSTANLTRETAYLLRVTGGA